MVFTPEFFQVVVFRGDSVIVTVFETSYIYFVYDILKKQVSIDSFYYKTLAF